MRVRLLHYSDIENAYDDPERIGRLAGLLESRRDAATVIAGTGDNTAPGVLSLVTSGRQALEFFSRVDPDVETFGNHDFDHGLAATTAIVEESPQTWVCANAYRDGEQFGRGVGVVPWTVVEAGGHRLGITGLLHEATPTGTPGAGDLTVTDPVDAARESIAALRREGVDHVVVLSHCGRRDDELARETTADVILGGHVHAERVDRIDGTLLARPGATARTVVELDLTEDGWAATRHAVDGAPIDEGVATALRELKAATGLGDVVGSASSPIERRRESVYAGECRVGNLVADAYRWATDADVGLQNSGGIRQGPPLAGEVTAADLVGVVPFDEPVAVTELTGEELLASFREACGTAVDVGEPDWWHAHVSGATIVRAADGTVRRALVDGRPVDPDARYTLATSAYLFHTPHEFPTLQASHREWSTDRRQYEVLVDYVREVGLDAAVEGRVVRREVCP